MSKVLVSAIGNGMGIGIHQQKNILRQAQYCCILTMLVSTLYSVHPVCPVTGYYMSLRPAT